MYGYCKIKKDLKAGGICLFGYIRPQKGELLVREFEQYRGFYCGLCKQLGKSYGFAARMTLSYDCTFLGMFFGGRASSCGGFHKGRCVVNPMKQCTFCGENQKELKLAAAVSVLLAYQKIRDDLRDGGIGKKLSRFFLLPSAMRANRKASKEYPQLAEACRIMSEQQARAEQDPDAGMDACAHPTGELLKTIFITALKELEGLAEDSSQGRILSQFGYHLGRWIYIMDACDDLEKDAKKKEFNPLLRKFRIDGTLPPEKGKEILLYANEALNITMSQITSAFRLLEFIQFGPILENIVFLGLPQMQKEILFLKKEKEHVGSV